MSECNPVKNVLQTPRGPPLAINVEIFCGCHPCIICNALVMAFRKGEREWFEDKDGAPVFYGPPENEYGLWREDQLDVLISKCTVNPFVPLGKKWEMGTGVSFVCCANVYI